MSSRAAAARRPGWMGRSPSNTSTSASDCRPRRAERLERRHLVAPFRLSSLELRSNLLTEEYQQEMRRITAREVKDIWRRNPNLKDALTPEQQRERTGRLPHNLTDAHRTLGDDRRH